MRKKSIMNRIQANAILDQHRDSAKHSILEVTRALWVTGDLQTGHRSPRVVVQVQEEGQGNWDAESPKLVAANDSGNRDQARPWVGAYLATRHEQDET